MTCPTGYHPRRAYTIKKTGTRVAASCIRSTTKAGSHANFVKSVKRRMTRRLQGFPRKNRGPTESACPAGTILRSAYVRERKNGSRVRVTAACIKNVGNPGKGLPSGAPGIGPLRKGDLSRFGYDGVIGMTEEARHAALTKAKAVYGSLTLWRKLNALYVYTRNTSPASSAIFKADRDWIRAIFGLKAFGDNAK